MPKAIDFIQTALSCKFVFDDGSEKNTVIDSEEYKKYFDEVTNKQVVVDVPVSPTPEPDAVQPESPATPVVPVSDETTVLPTDGSASATVPNQDVELDPSVNPDVTQPTPDQPQVTVEPETAPAE